MNTILEQAAAREGWQWVGGIASRSPGATRLNPTTVPAATAFAHHRNNWVNSLWDSIDEEGGDIDGAWHANRTGQAVVMDQLLNSMTPILGLNMPPMPPEIVAFSVDTTDTPTQSFAPNCIDNFTDQLECLSIVPGSTVALSGLVEGIAGYVGTTTVQFTASAGHVTPTDTVQPNGYYGPFGGNFTAPLTAGTVSIAATAENGGGSSPPGSISIPVPPEVSSVSPGHGVLSGGTPVTITGAGFGSHTQVYFGSVPATDVHVISTHLLTALTPPSNSSEQVNVTVNSGGLSSVVEASLPVEFDYFVPWVPFLLAGLPASCGGRASRMAAVRAPTASDKAGAVEPYQMLHFILSDTTHNVQPQSSKRVMPAAFKILRTTPAR